ncbi:MAG: SRPBCC family protein, partial [Phycisphaerales bacterium]|nr:SRPBCC family protein [Phycisphaerales bacterium]
MLIYIVITIVGLLVTLFGVLGMVGSFVPETHTASMSVDVATPIDRVWAAIDDPASFPQWLPGVDAVEMLPDKDGRRAFRQKQGRNSFVLEETVKHPPTLVTRTITDDNGPFSGSWEHRLEDLGDQFGVSKERVRQLEVRIKQRLGEFVKRRLGQDVIV